MTFTEAAIEVLRKLGKPLHYKKITEIAIADNLLSHVGKTPEVTMSARLAMIAKKDTKDNPIVKVKPGVFALREFDEKAMADLPAEEAESETNSLEQSDNSDSGQEDKRSRNQNQRNASTQSQQSSQDEESDDSSTDNGSSMFPEEEDDDEPILAGLDEDSSLKRSRRRRRKRRRGSDDEVELSANENDEEAPKAARVPQRQALEWDHVADSGDIMGKDLADAVYSVMQGQSTQPRTFTSIAEKLVGLGRLSGSPQALAATVAAAIRADRARSRQRGQRTRFEERTEGVILADWLIPPEVQQEEAALSNQVERYRESVLRAFTKKLSALPPSGFIQLLATWLNARSVTSLSAVKRPGTSSREFHMTGVLKDGETETHLAIVIRRDGRDVDRELVVDVRGSLHHYGQASSAWLITTGSVRSGAREEASEPSAAPVRLFDGNKLIASMEAYDLGLKRVQLSLPMIDFDSLEEFGASIQLRESSNKPAGRNGRNRRNRRRGGDRNRGRGNNGDGNENENFDASDTDSSLTQSRQSSDSTEARYSAQDHDPASAGQGIMDPAGTKDSMREPSTTAELSSGMQDAPSMQDSLGARGSLDMQGYSEESSSSDPETAS